jgi:hypothetical protein
MADDLPPSRLLLVEGADDEHVVRRLCERQQDMPDFDIIDKRGFPNLKAAIGPEIKAPGRTALGILVDADDDIEARWNAIAYRLRQAAIDLPPQPTTQGGTVIEGTPRVGVWLMPDNQSAGELEDFIRRLIPAGDPVWPRAEGYIDGIPADDRQFAAGKILRAKLHAWLATRAEPRKMGAAIGVGDLDATDPLATQFVAWLRRLFV